MDKSLDTLLQMFKLREKFLDNVDLDSNCLLTGGGLGSKEVHLNNARKFLEVLDMNIKEIVDYYTDN